VTLPDKILGGELDFGQFSIDFLLIFMHYFMFYLGMG